MSGVGATESSRCPGGLPISENKSYTVYTNMNHPTIFILAVLAWQSSVLPHAAGACETKQTSRKSCCCGDSADCKCCCSKKDNSDNQRDTTNKRTLCKCQLPQTPLTTNNRISIEPPREIAGLTMLMYGSSRAASGCGTTARATAHSPPTIHSFVDTYILLI